MENKVTLDNIMYMIPEGEVNPSYCQFINPLNNTVLYWSGMSPEDVAKEKGYKSYKIVDSYTWVKFANDYYKSLDTPFQRITEEKFYDMFECLPPHSIVHFTNGFLFRMSEFNTGYNTGTYIKLTFKGKDYFFTADRSAFMTEEDTMLMVNNEVIPKCKE
jgi:hypothetical protein